MLSFTPHVAALISIAQRARALRVLALACCVAPFCSCATDVKGASCSPLDTYTNDAGDAYCPDPDAPKDCDTVFDAIIAKTVECANAAGNPITEAEVRAQVDLPDCKTAVATTTDFDQCVDELSAAQCAADGSFSGPEICKGAVLTSQ